MKDLLLRRCQLVAVAFLAMSSCGTRSELEFAGSLASGGAPGAGEVSSTGSGGRGIAAQSVCGNSRLEPGETCDDENFIAGDGCSPKCRAEPVKVVALHDITCALSSQGEVKCWGYDYYGALGLGDRRERGSAPSEMGEGLPALDLGSGRRAVDIFRGPCALLDDGSLKCWGYNGTGALGLGDFRDRGVQPGEMGDALPSVALGTGRQALMVSGNGSHTCGVLDDGSLKCWGSNTFGTLGLGDERYRGTQPGEMGDALPAVDLGLGLTARSVAVGHSRSCAVLDSGSLKCWGYNRTGLLGLGDKEFRGDEPDEMGDALPDIDLGESSRATLVSVGSSHTCALLESGLVKCWGNASLGELGLGDQEQRGDEPGEMGEALPPVDLGRGERARTLSAGGDHTCAVLENDSLKCWGNSFLGQVGLGDTVVHGDEPGEMGDALPTVDLGVGLSVRSVSAGRSHSCALLHDGTMKCWGSNEYGQLGLGDRENRGDEPGEMGDALPTVDLAF